MLGEDKCTSVCQEVPILEKSQSLSEAIDYIDNVLERTSNLADRINGTKVSGDTPKPDIARPSLSDVLTSGSEAIRGKCDSIHDRLSLIENLLF